MTLLNHWRCVTDMSQYCNVCGYMGYGLKLITFYAQTHVAVLEMCHNQPLVRNKPLESPASVKLVYLYLFLCIVSTRTLCQHLLFLWCPFGRVSVYTQPACACMCFNFLPRGFLVLLIVPIAVAFSDVCSLVYVRYERDLNEIYMPNDRNGAPEAVI